MEDPTEAGSLYERAGGLELFVSLVDRFYQRVGDDPILRPLYPERDLAGARARLTSFLVERSGGPKLYESLRGEPKLRLRHLDFPISKREADVWLGHMSNAVAEVVTSPGVAAELTAYFEATGSFLINTGGLALKARIAPPSTSETEHQLGGR